MKIKLAAAAVCVLMATSACGSSGSASKGPDNSAPIKDAPSATLRYAASAGVTSFDPHKGLASSNFVLLNFVYDRLVHTDADGKPVPGLATSWKFSDDARELTFTLREGLKFSDGTVFDAAAAKANLDRAMEPDSITSTLLAPIASVAAPNAKTVVLTLDQPGAQLPLTLSDLPGMMVSPKAFGDKAKDDALTLAPVGIGRFTLDSAKPGASYVFKRSPGYWDRREVKVGTLDVAVVTDPQTTLNGVSSGQFDCALASPMTIDPAKKLSNAWVDARTVLTQTVLYFNRTHGDLDKVEARRAIALAINKENILTAAQEGHGQAATQLFPKGYFAHDDSIDANDYDPAAAKDMLAKAGLKDGFSFSVAVINIPQFVTTATLVREDLKKVGITMDIKLMTPADVGVNFLKGETDAVMSGWTGRPDPSNLFSAYFGAASPQNASKATLPGFEEALEKANSELDATKRGKALADVGRLILEQGGVVPLTQNDVGVFCRDNVGGYQAPVIGISELRGIGFTS